MSNNYDLPPKLKLTPEQEEAAEMTRASAMRQAPFYQHFYYNTMEDWPTNVIPTLATNGAKLFYNPDYLVKLQYGERTFAWVHEIVHAVDRHPQRIQYYLTQGHLQGLPFVDGYGNELFNVMADYQINADLVRTNVGTINPSWLYDLSITNGDDLTEDLYKKHFKKPPTGRSQSPQPQGQPGGGQGQGNQQGNQKGSKPGNQFKPGNIPGFEPSTKGGRNRPDPAAEAQQGRFDKVIVPHRDPISGREDQISEGQFKEAVAGAAAAAKAVGNLPASVQRKVDAILDPQVNWRDHIRTLLLGKLGRRRENWTRPNRRRLVLNPIIFMPGRTPYGAGTVAVVIDNSGSISDREFNAFFAEVTGLIDSCRPRQVIVIWCDAAIRRVERVRSLSDVEHIRKIATEGGGGTSFVPPFKYLEKENIQPETLIYLTDMLGSFPAEPKFPVVWCATTDKKGPFGETVHIKI